MAWMNEVREEGRKEAGRKRKNGREREEWFDGLICELNKSYLSLQLRVDKEDEIECIIRGGNFLLKNISNEVFAYHKEQSPPYVFQDLNHSEIFPYLIVNIGSGVSMIKVKLTWRLTVQLCLTPSYPRKSRGCYSGHDTAMILGESSSQER